MFFSWKVIYAFLAAKQEVLTGSKNLLKNINRIRRRIEATIVKGRGRALTDVWKRFESSYDADIKVR